MNLAAKVTILTVGDTKTEPFVEFDNLRPGRCRFQDNAFYEVTSLPARLWQCISINIALEANLELLDPRRMTRVVIPLDQVSAMVNATRA